MAMAMAMVEERRTDEKQETSQNEGSMGIHRFTFSSATPVSTSTRGFDVDARM